MVSENTGDRYKKKGNKAKIPKKNKIMFVAFKRIIQILFDTSVCNE